MSPKNHLKQFLEDKTTGEILCACGCGHVVEEKTMSTLDERSDSDKIMASRPRNTITRHDTNISAGFQKSLTDANSHKISATQKMLYERLHRQDQRSQNSSPETRRMICGLEAIKDICNKMQFSFALFESSSFIYRKAMKSMNLKGRPIMATAAACVYHALKMANIQMKYSDLCDTCQISWKQAKKAQYEITMGLDFVEKTGVTKPRSYIEKFVKDLELTKKTILFAADIANIVSDKGLLEGHPPRGIAAASIYLANLSLNPASRINKYRFFVNQREIAQVCDVREQTIRTLAREMIPHIKEAVKKYRGEMPT